MPLDLSTDPPIFKWCYRGKLAKVQRILVNHPQASGLKSNKNGGITPLLAAVRGNRLATVQWLINHEKASCSERDDLGNTALIWAAHNDNQPMIECLLKSGSTVDECGKFGDTALTWAAYKRHFKLCQWLIKTAGADPHKKDEFGSSIFLWATEGGDFDIINWLFKSNYGTLDERDDDGNTALLIAAKAGYLHLMQPLLEMGAAVDAENLLAQGVLTQATVSGNLELVKWLVNPANSNLSNRSLEEPLFTAIRYNHKHIVEWIIAHPGIPIDVIGKKRNTPLIYAAKHGRLSILKCLLDHSANPEAMDIRGNTPLLKAAYKGHLKVVQFLINSKKAAEHVSNQDGDTIFLSAALKGQLPVMQWLLKWDPSLINNQDTQGKTALFKAASHGDLEVVYWLVNLKKIAANHKDHRGNTVLMAAANNDCFEIVRYFIDNKILTVLELNHEGKSALDLAIEKDENGKTALFLYHYIKFMTEANHLYSSRPRKQLNTLCLGEQQEVSRLRILCQHFLTYDFPIELIQFIHILDDGCLTEIANKRIYDEEVLFLEFSKRKSELVVGKDFLNGLNFMMQKPKAHKIPSEKKLTQWRNLNATLLLLIQFNLKEEHKIPPEHNPIHTLAQNEIKALQSEVTALQGEIKAWQSEIKTLQTGKANLQKNYNFILKTMGTLCLLGGSCLAFVLTSTSSDSQERSFLNMVMATTFVGGLSGAYCFFKCRQEKHAQQQENRGLSQGF